MANSNIVVTHADTGLVTAEVVRAERISSHFVRVTLGGAGLADWRWLGFDQWVRLAVPVTDDVRFDNLPDRFGIGGYLRYLATDKATRPVIRNYTLRDWRADGDTGPELDVDFVVHGTEGVAGPWAERLPVGDPVALIDQGCGYRDRLADTTLLVGDESALPAVVGVLRDLDRAARGTAIIEVPAADDAQAVDAPAGMDVRWVVRGGSDAPGESALRELTGLGAPRGSVNAFAVGESKLATGARRLLVGTHGVPKDRVTFSGYWRAGRSATS